MAEMQGDSVRERANAGGRRKRLPAINPTGTEAIFQHAPQLRQDCVPVGVGDGATCPVSDCNNAESYAAVQEVEIDAVDGSRIGTALD